MIYKLKIYIIDFLIFIQVLQILFYIILYLLYYLIKDIIFGLTLTTDDKYLVTASFDGLCKVFDCE